MQCFPGVHPFNAAAYEIHSYANGQFIMSSGGPVALDLLAVDKIFDYLKVDDEDRAELYIQVQEIASVAISTQYREAERLRKLEEAKRR